MPRTKKVTLQITHLYKNFGNIQASEDLNFTAYRGDVIALLGANGAGKSTLMNMIAGYLAPTSGKISVLDKDIADFPLFAKQNIGFLAEGAPLYNDMTVRMFLNYMAQLRLLKQKDVEQAIKLTNLANVLEQKIDTLSKGYRRRVGLAQSILSNPPILLLDEPTDGLDPHQKEHIRDLIKNMAAHKTILISTHLLEEAETVCNRIILLSQGKIVADGNLKQILQQAKSASLDEAFRQLTQQEK